MKIWDKIKELIIPQSIPETEYGMSEIDFFIKALEYSPVGATICLEKFEPENWAVELYKWSYRKNEKQLEADYYTITDEFIDSLRSILSEDPKSMNAIAHFTIVDINGRPLVESNDNFTLVNVSESMKIKLLQR